MATTQSGMTECGMKTPDRNIIGNVIMFARGAAVFSVLAMPDTASPSAANPKPPRMMSGITSSQNMA